MRRKIKQVLLLLICFGMFHTNVFADQTPTFQEFEEQALKDSIQDDYMTYHFFGFDDLNYEKPEVVLNLVDEDQATAKEENQQELDLLKQIDSSALDAKQKHLYQAYMWTLENNAIGYDLPDYTNYFSSSNGIVDNMITNFHEFRFEKQEHIDDYLNLLKQSEQEIQQAISLSEKSAAMNFAPTNLEIDEIVNQLQEMIEHQPFVLVASFDEKLNQIDWLDESTKNQYRQENETICKTVVIPSIQKAIDFVQTLKDKRKVDDGLYYFDQGEEYYNLLFHSYTSYQGSIDEMIDILKEEINQSLKEYSASKHSTFTATTPEEILNELRSHMDYFPEGASQEYSIAYDHTILSNSTLAYYLKAPVNNFNQNVIKLNGNVDFDVNELRFTLAHEAYPGHLYQKTYFLNQNPNYLQYLIDYIGYSEGWAQYSADLLVSTDEAEEVLQKRIEYYVLSLCDILIHAKGYKPEDLVEFGKSIGLEFYAEGFYDYLVNQPGLMLSYGASYAYFQHLYRQAKSALGQQFDYVEFHRAILDEGPLPLLLVKENVDAYVNQQAPAHSTNMSFYYVAGAFMILAVCILVFRKKKKSL